MHATAPVMANVPAGHRVGEVVCALGQKSPGGQSSQKLLSWQVGENEPAGQALQELFEREKKQPAQHPHAPQSQETGGEDVVGGAGGTAVVEGGVGVRVVDGGGGGGEEVTGGEGGGGG